MDGRTGRYLVLLEYGFGAGALRGECCVRLVLVLLVLGTLPSKCDVLPQFLSCFLMTLSSNVPIPLPSDTHIIHAALIRAAYPSLGSIVLSALILTGIRLLGLLILALRLFPLYLPLALRPWCRPVIIGSGMAVAYLESVTTSLSKYALVYTGLTGDAFFVSARRGRALTAAVESVSAGRYRRKFKTERTYIFTAHHIIADVPFSTIKDAYICTLNFDLSLRTHDVPFCRTHLGCT